MRVPDDESLLEEHSDRAQFRIASIRRQPARFPASGPGTFRNALPCCGPGIDYAQQVGTLELNAGVKNSLIAKLRAAQQSMTRSDAPAAGNQLNAFINQVRALERSGRLDQVTANSLVGAVEEIIKTI